MPVCWILIYTHVDLGCRFGVQHAPDATPERPEHAPRIDHVHSRQGLRWQRQTVEEAMKSRQVVKGRHACARRVVVVVVASTVIIETANHVYHSEKSANVGGSPAEECMALVPITARQVQMDAQHKSTRHPPGHYDPASVAHALRMRPEQRPDHHHSERVAQPMASAFAPRGSCRSQSW